ncbi:FGGY-family carbohydrate kinase [Nocardioides fonticola]|uniref:FGGY-family carbohydrate kinase n=1 Tax=Nocardioides fonticola TaxID=450363 RepID=A0ABP7XDS4_9ACTN
MTDLLLAIDGGSQSTKVSVIDAEGAVLASAAVALRPYELGPEGRAVHPDDDLWDSLTAATQQALARFRDAGGDLARLAAVGLCGIRFCRALLDAEGRLVEPVLSWMDARVSRPLAEQRDPRVALVVSAGGYLAVRLTGERRDSAASYQGMWPLDPVTRQWSADPEAFARTGMPRDLLPHLVDPGGLLGTVTAEAAAASGLPVGLPVYATGNDKAVEALGAGLVDPGTTLLSLGTYIAAMTVAEAHRPDGDVFWVNGAAEPGRYLVESVGIRRGMWTVTWLRRLVTAACAEPDADPAAVQAWLEREATAVPAGCGGLRVVPDWLAPGDAPHRRGTILGLDGSHGAAELHRAVLEGIVLTMRRHTAAMETAIGLVADRLIVSGGGARSPLMCRIAADVFDRPVERTAVEDAAGLGSAICAAVGHGLHPDVASAVKAMVRPGALVHPDPTMVERYRAIAADHDRILEHTDAFYAARS